MTEQDLQKHIKRSLEYLRELTNGSSVMWDVNFCTEEELTKIDSGGILDMLARMLARDIYIQMEK